MIFYDTLDVDLDVDMFGSTQLTYSLPRHFSRFPTFYMLCLCPLRVSKRSNKQAESSPQRFSKLRSTSEVVLHCPEVIPPVKLGKRRRVFGTRLEIYPTFGEFCLEMLSFEVFIGCQCGMVKSCKKSPSL